MGDPKSRRFASALLATVILLSACVSQNGTATPSQGQGQGQSQTAGPIDPRRTTLNIGVASEANSFDPQVNTAQISAERFYPNIYETLVRWGADNVLHPMLADSWSASNDGLTYTFKLHPGVKFSDGTPFNAAAVKASFDRFNTLGKGATLLFEPIDRIVAVDDATASFVLKRPYTPILSVLASWQAAIFVSPAAIKEHDGGDNAQTWLKDHTAGTGPYTVDSWVPSNKLVLVRNPQFREAAAADSIQRIVYQFIAEPSTLRQQFESGDIDIADVLAPSLVEPLKRAAGVTVHQDESPGSGFGFWIAFNLSRKPFDDVNLRQAVSYAIDYKRLIALWNGIADQSQGPYPKSFKPWFSTGDALQYNQDLAKAGDALRKGGYSVPLNPPLNITLTWQASAPIQRDMSTLIKEDLAKIGVNVDVQSNEIPVWRQNIWNHTFDATWFQESHRYADPDAFASFQVASSEWRVGGTNPGVRDVHIDELIQQGKIATDPTKRQQIYNELQRLVTQNPPYLYIADVKVAWGNGNDVTGINWITAYGQFWYGHEIKKKASRS